MSSPSPNQEAFEATKIQLSKYSGLAIVPVKEQSGQVTGNVWCRPIDVQGGVGHQGSGGGGKDAR